MVARRGHGVAVRIYSSWAGGVRVVAQRLEGDVGADVSEGIRTGPGSGVRCRGCARSKYLRAVVGPVSETWLASEIRSPISCVTNLKVPDCKPHISVLKGRLMIRLVYGPGKRPAGTVKLHDEIGDSIIDVQQELTTTIQQQKALAAQLKELKLQKKELDRVPRHSTSGRTAQSTSSIPQLVGNADSDSDVDSAAPQTSSSSPPVSSPAPLLRRASRFPLSDYSHEYAALDCNDTDFPIGICTTAPSESVAFDPEFNAPLDSLPALCPEPPRSFNQESAVPAPVFPQPHLNILAEDLFSFPPVSPQPLLDIPDKDLFSFLDTPGFDSGLFSILLPLISTHILQLWGSTSLHLMTNLSSHPRHPVLS
ncbi:hypothetical protein B0H17DRAFT_1127224 [Mycena rosella]|uniref:Uncharacterized protein n=1 Tax=Mycena rosella TaxID=1033263 RepID=A0AAD7GNT5_MYCRO|nr:hypothetical protein B0H17DRAFT_1127224 [Mycena rosella]